MRLSVSLLLALVLVGLSTAPADAANPFPRAGSAYLVKAGDATIWSHRADRRMPPASLTKIMTALLVIEQGGFDEVVTISAEAAAETGSRLRLRAGEQLRVGDLLTALLLKSANDAAHALADHVAGREEIFVARMNRRAAELGMKNTRFANASGLDHPRQYTTAADLARLTEAALAYAPFREMIGLAETEIRTVDGERTFPLRNTNRLVGHYEGLIGGKTGYTSKAGPCLIAVAERGEERVLLVLLNSRSRWATAPSIFDRAFKGSAARRAQVARVTAG